jgi:lipopolysaccharide transport system permease protein
MVKIPSDGIPYPIFSYCALLPWQFFSSSFTSGTSSLVSNSNLVQQIYFPREIFPLSSVIASFIDFLIASSIFIILLIFYKVHITFYALFAVLLLILQILFVVGISFLGSALNVFYRDVSHALTFITQIWMFATPIIYPVSVVPEKLRPFYLLNPMAGIIDGYRRVIIQGLPPDWQYVGIATVVTLVVLVFSYKYFKKVEMKFADVI